MADPPRPDRASAPAQLEVSLHPVQGLPYAAGLVLVGAIIVWMSAGGIAFAGWKVLLAVMAVLLIRALRERIRHEPLPGFAWRHA